MVGISIGRTPVYRGQLPTDEPDLPYPRAIVAQSLALTANAPGNHRLALDYAVGALGNLLEFGELSGFAVCLDTVAAAQGALGQPGRAARLFAAAATARAAVGIPMIQADQPWYDHANQVAKRTLGKRSLPLSGARGGLSHQLRRSARCSPILRKRRRHSTAVRGS